MDQYTQLTLEEREMIYTLKKSGWPTKVIANFMERHKSTIYRELNRNLDTNLGYLPDRAHKMAQERKHRLERKISRNPLLKFYILHKLISEGWSPEMISGRSKLLSLPFKVSAETTYQYIFSEEGKELGLYKYLYSQVSCATLNIVFRLALLKPHDPSSQYKAPTEDLLL